MSRAQYDYAIAGRPLVARRARVADIITIAANLSGVTVAELMGERRLRRISRVRFAIYAIACENGHSAYATGLRFGGRDHTSVLHGCKQCAEFVKRYPDYAAFVDDLRAAAKATEPFPPLRAPPRDKDEEQGIASRQDIRAGSCALAAAITEARAA